MAEIYLMTRDVSLLRSLRRLAGRARRTWAGSICNVVCVCVLRPGYEKAAYALSVYCVGSCSDKVLSLGCASWCCNCRGDAMIFGECSSVLVVRELRPVADEDDPMHLF